MDDFPEHWGGRRFFEFVDFHGLWPNASLESISGLPSRVGPFETPLIEWIETAWRTPLKDLTCEQVRLHLGQRQGLEWLGRPILEFVERYPRALITNYEGELVASAFRAAEELIGAVPEEFCRWMRQDFSWLQDVFGWDEDLMKDVNRSYLRAVEVARTAPCTDS